MILVTGATGNVGSVVLNGLLKLGIPTRAAVTNPARVAAKLPANAAIAQFDFNDISCFPAALEGVKRVFLMRPPDMGDAKAFKPFLRAIRAAQIEQVVFLSLLGAQANPVVPHRKIELEIEKLEIPHVFLRPSFFLQNLNGTHLEDITKHDDIFVPAGKGRTGFIDARDIASVAVRALSVPHIVNGGVDLTGAQALGYAEVAAIFSEVLGRTIRYSDPPPLKFGLEMQRRGIKPEFVNVMILIYNTNRFGLAARVTTDVKRILGREPLGVKEFVTDFKDLFAKVSKESDETANRPPSD
jgi:uncharacterized protein YbjT (DUF2867 family)